MKRVFLVGYMGAGKTTVGKELAKLAGLSFIDLVTISKGVIIRPFRDIRRERGGGFPRDRTEYASRGR